MHYYRFHVNDYQAATAHLTNEQDLVYRRCLDWYYSTEQALPLDTAWLSRRLRVDLAILEQVLTDMFERTDAGFRNKRCEEELAEYQKLADRNRENGKRRVAKKASRKPVASQRDPSGIPVASQSQPSGIPLGTKPITSLSNQVTSPNTEKNTSASDDAPTARRRSVQAERPEDVTPATWEGFLAIRKARRAPLTVGALDGIRAEAAKANVTLEAALLEAASRGWQSFRSDWVQPQPGGGGKAPLKFSKPATHMPNMPLGTAACACNECVAYRNKRGVM